MIRICEVCGAVFEVKSQCNRRKYCSAECARIRDREKRVANRRAIHAVRSTDYPIPYNPKQAQASHDRQAEIERRAREVGMSYGKYQMMKYLEANG